MHRYAWRCADCAFAISHVSESSDPYVVGFEIYSKHARISPKCKNRTLEIFPERKRLPGRIKTVKLAPSITKFRRCPR